MRSSYSNDRNPRRLPAVGQTWMSSPKPDIVFFMVDQLSAKWLEAASNGIVATPGLDRLRAAGTTFTNCISSNPLCCPTRATLATGLTTRGHGVLQNGYALDPELPTFMRSLQDAGWRTVALGKLHLRPHYETIHPDYLPYGFDVQHNTEDDRGGEWLDWVRAEHPEHRDAVYSTVWSRDIPGFANYGPTAENLRAELEEVPAINGTYELPFPEELSQTNWITGHALDFIRGQAPAQPIYAHVSYVQPHGPFAPPAGYRQFVDAEAIPAPIPPEWPGDPLAPHCLEGRGCAQTPSDWRKDREHYFADIRHLDRQLGLLLDTLEQTGRRDNTYVIMLADHGELLHDHGLTGKGEFHYDACIRVPLVIAGPGINAGQSRDELVQLEDIFPTIFEMVGLSLPKPKVIYGAGPPAGGVGGPTGHTEYPYAPGRSLLGLCRGEASDHWRDCAYVESYNNINSATTANWARSIRTTRWRYTMYPDNTGEQLFDLVDDSDETRNLAADPDHRQIRLELRDRLLDLIIHQDYPHSPRSRFAFGVH